jgi:DNA ligase-associated metallophosphoesterase
MSDLLPPASTLPAPAPLCLGADGSVTATLGGESLCLLADRALFWPRESTLFVADVHLGKAASLRAGGIPVPRGATAGDLGRLGALVRATEARRLVVLGDLLHARAGRVAALDAAITAWRAQFAALEIVLVRGNHDEHAGDPPPGWRIDVRAAPHRDGPFLLQHEPAIPPTGHALAGHVHPGVTLRGKAGDAVRLACFVVGPRRTILPAFGRLTGHGAVAPRADQVCVAIAGSRLHILAPPTARRRANAG